MRKFLHRLGNSLMKALLRSSSQVTFSSQEGPEGKKETGR